MKICFFDLDGTLLTDEKIISYRTKKSLVQLHEKGVLIGYITARTKRKISNLISDLPCDFVASYDGALVECFANDGTTETILNECIDDVVAHKLIRKLSELQDVDVFSYFEPYHIFNDMVSCIDNESIVRVYNTETAHLFSGCQRVRGRSKGEISVFSNLKNYQNVSSYIENNDIVFRNTNVNKGNAVLSILNYYGLSNKDAIAFGDTEPDIDMFKQCYIAVAMDNATLKTKENATFITLSNNEDGVAEAIDRIFGIR